MKTYRKPVQGNRYSVHTDCDKYNYFQLWDDTRQILLADGNDDTELILFAQHNNLINGQIVVVG